MRGGPPAPEPELWAPAGPAPPNHFVPDRKVSEVRREPSLPRAHYTPQYAAPRPPVDHPVAPRAPMEYPADPRPPVPDQRPPVPTSRPPTTTTDRGTARRAPSFADRLRHAESGVSRGGRELIAALWYNLLKSLGCSVVNLFPREVPRVLNLFPRELIESTPKDFPNANPKLHQRPDPRLKT